MKTGSAPRALTAEQAQTALNAAHAAYTEAEQAIITGSPNAPSVGKLDQLDQDVRRAELQLKAAQHSERLAAADALEARADTWATDLARHNAADSIEPVRAQYAATVEAMRQLHAAITAHDREAERLTRQADRLGIDGHPVNGTPRRLDTTRFMGDQLEADRKAWDYTRPHALQPADVRDAATLHTLREARENHERSNRHRPPEERVDWHERHPDKAARLERLETKLTD